MYYIRFIRITSSQLQYKSVTIPKDTQHIDKV